MISREETNLIAAIAKRANQMSLEAVGYEYKNIDAFMDIEFVHKKHPLRLGELLNASDGQFGHDVFGIRTHFNRETKELEDGFFPRYAVQ